MLSHWLHTEQGGAAGGAGGGAHVGGGPLRILRRGLHCRKAPARPRPRVVPSKPHLMLQEVFPCWPHPLLCEPSCRQPRYGPKCMRIRGVTDLHTGARSRPARARRGRLPGAVCGGRHGARRVWGRALRAGMPFLPSLASSWAVLAEAGLVQQAVTKSRPNQNS